MRNVPPRQAVLASALAKWAWLTIGVSLLFSGGTAAENGPDVVACKDYTEVVDALRPFIQRDRNHRRSTDCMVAGIRIGGPREKDAGNRRDDIPDRIGFETVYGHRHHAARRAGRTEPGCSDHPVST